MKTRRRTSNGAASLIDVSSTDGPVNYKSMTKAELVERLERLDAEKAGVPANNHEVALEHELHVHQIELEMQNRQLRDTQSELEMSRDRYMELYDFAPVAYMNFDTHGKLRALNLAAAALLGRERASLLDVSFSGYLEMESARAFRKHLQHCRETGERHSIELRLRAESSRWIPVLLTTVFNPSLQAENACFLSTVQDLTDRRRAEDLQQRYAQELEQKVEERTAALRDLNTEMELFCASVSHDLRAPLRVIRGFADVLSHDAGGKLNEEERSNLQRIINNTLRLDRLLQDLLAYSRVARAELTLVPVDLKELIGDVISVQRGIQRERAGQMTIQGPAMKVLAHPSVLSQVIWNLIDNAHKFVPPGVIPEILIRTESLGDRVRVWIEDNGIGIDPVHHDRIFMLFERLNHDRSEGTGVGLALAKRAIIRMGGRIGVESAENQGSRFWIELQEAK